MYGIIDIVRDATDNELKKMYVIFKKYVIFRKIGPQ